MDKFLEGVGVLPRRPDLWGLTRAHKSNGGIDATKGLLRSDRTGSGLYFPVFTPFLDANRIPLRLKTL